MIPGLLVYLARRRDVPFRPLFWLFGAFILSCGFTHLTEVILFYVPIYRFAGVLKLATGLVSLATVAALVPVVPKVLQLRSPEELEGEVAVRRRAEVALREQSALVELMQAVAASANAATTAEEAFRLTLERVCAHLGWPIGHVYWSAPGGAEVVPAPTWHVVGDPGRFAAFRATSDAGPVAAGVGLVGRVLAERRPVWLQDAPGAMAPARGGAARAAGVRAALAFPVRVGDEVAAVLEFFAESPAPPDAAMLAVAENLGTQLGRVVERQRAEAAVEAQARLLRSVLDHMAEAVLVADADGRVILSNPAVARLLGAPDPAGGPLDPAGDSPLARAVRGEEVRDVEVTVRDGDGDDAPARRLLVSGSPLPAQFGGPAVGLVVCRDITARHAAEEAQLRAARAEAGRAEAERAERHLRRVLDSLACAVGVMTPEGALVEVNRAALDSAGLRPEQVLGRPLERTLWWGSSPEGLARLRQAIASAADGRPDRFDAELRAAGGRTMVADVTLAPMYDDDGRVGHLVPSAIDITDRKRAEDEVRALNATLEGRVRERTAELEESNRELEAFSYSVSHDLRAPLRHISGFADLLERRAGPGLDDGSRRYLRTIADSARAAGAMIDSLLAFSRLGRSALKVGPVDMGRLVEEVRVEVESEADGRAVAWEVGPLPTVQADPALLRLVMRNLLSNALKYSRTRAEARVGVDCEETGDEFRFAIRDNGVGFDMKYVDKLFGVFQRLHAAEEFEGTGIGLANVRRIVQRHGGRAWAEGRPDGGATFFFTLPRAGATAVGGEGDG